MLKFCLKQWDANKDKLRFALQKEKGLSHCYYGDIVEIVCREILVDHCFFHERRAEITEIDDNVNCGELVFVIPMKLMPQEYDYLLTFISYGSCPVCDTLYGIQSGMGEHPNEQQLEDLMSLCKDIVTNIVKPYNKGWRHNENFDEVEYE